MIKQDMNAFRIPDEAFGPVGQARPLATPRRPDPEPVAPAAPPPSSPAAVARNPRPSPLAILRSEARLIMGVVAAGMLAVLLVLSQVTPVYRASTVIQVTDPSLTAMLGSPVDALESWGLAEKVVLKLKLTRDPEINRALSKRSLFNVASWFREERPAGRVVVPPGTGQLTVKPELLARFAERLEVAQGATPASVSIVYESADPEKAAQVANAVVAQFMLEYAAAITDATGAPSEALALELAAQAEKARSAETALERFRASVGDGAAPAQAARLRELEADATASRNRYETLLSRATLSPSPGTGIRVVARAFPPDRSDLPSTPVIMGVTLAGSTSIAFMLAFARAGRRTLAPAAPAPRVVPAAEAAQDALLLTSAILATVPALPQGDGVPIQRRRQAIMAFSEAILSLYQNLMAAAVAHPPRVVVLAPVLPGAGTTSLAVSLGRTVAGTGQRVLLLDANLRRPGVAARFAEEAPVAGLVDVLAGKVELANAICQDPDSTLDYLPVAAGAMNPAELLGSRSMQRLIEVLRQHYALVIIDAPALLQAPDARALAGVADRFVMVARSGATPSPRIAACWRQLQQAGAGLAGLVLTQAPLEGTLGVGTGRTHHKVHAKH